MMSGVVVLGDVATFIRGITFKPDDVISVDADDAVACMRTKNVQAQIDLEDVWGIPRRFVKRQDQFLKFGDLLISTANSWNLVGKCSWVPELPWPSTLGGFISALRPNVQRVHPRYLFWWFGYDKTQAIVRSFGRKTTSISNLSLEQCLAMEMPLPSLAEQRRIADILDKADALRAQRRAALADLDILAQSTFLDLFGDPAANPKRWPVGVIGDLLDSATYGTSIKSGPTGQFPVLRMNNISRTGDMLLSDLKYMDLDESEYDRYLARSGDVLFNRTNSPELVGKTAVFRELVPMAYAGYLIRLRVNAKNHSEFLSAYLNMPFSKRELRGMCKSIIGMANINAKEIQTMRTMQPPLALQQSFARRITAIESLKSRHRAALAELDTLFASLQHRAFRGEL